MVIVMVMRIIGITMVIMLIITMGTLMAGIKRKA